MSVTNIVLTASGPVSAEIMSTENTCSGTFGIESPSAAAIFSNYDTLPLHSDAIVGTFSSGQELVFYLDVSNTGCGAPGIPHKLSTDSAWAHVLQIRDNLWEIDWEDADSGTGDFNDLVVRVGIPSCTTTCVQQYQGTGSDPNQRQPFGLLAEPVNTLSGGYATDVTDLALPGRGLGFAFTRSYDSVSSSVDGPLGPGWTHGYGDHLVFNGDGSVNYATANGSIIPYAPDGSGGFTRGPGVLSTLATAQGGGYAVTRSDGLRLGFDVTGRLTSETDRNANAITFAYTGADLTTIVDTVGRAVTLVYNGAHHITSLTDPTGRSVGYAYDGTGRLATVTDTRGGATNLTYDPSGHLATITDQIGHTLVTNTYDSAGRVVSQVDARGKQTSFSYDLLGETRTVTDPLGRVTVDTYDGPALVSRQNAEGFVTSYAYDSQLTRTSVTDPTTGGLWTMTYDTRGNLLTRTSPAPLSYVETFTYDALNDVLTAKDRRGLTTTYAYDGTGNLTRTTATDSSHADATYDSHGLVLTSTDARGKSTTYGRDSQSNLNRITTPLGEVTTSTYDGVGRLAATVDPRGNVAGADPAQYTTTYTFDAANNPLTTSDPLGNVTTMAYNPAGNLTSVTDANQHATSYAYDAANHLLSVTDAAGGITAYAYDDVGNVVTRTDAKSHVTTYTYDSNNALHSTMGPDGHTWYQNHSTSGILFSEARPLGSVGYVYDALGRPTTITFQTTYTLNSRFTYDADGNRLTTTGGPYTSTQTYAYDTMNRLTSETDESSKVFGYTYDASGNVLTRTYPDGTVTTYTYDDDGRLATVVTADAIMPGPDTTLPAVPTGLTAIVVSTTQVDLAWTAATDNVGVQGYKLYRNGTYLSSIGPVGSTTFSDTGLTSGTAYTYKVSSIDAAGNESAQSTAAAATPGPDTAVPTVPTGLAGTAPAANRVNLTWTASTDNWGVTGYRIYRAGTLIFSVAGTATSASDWNVAPSSTYGYTVAALDAAGNASAQSATASVTTPAGSGTTFAADTFTRTVSGGWGSADKGGAWSSTTSAFAVTGSTGTISLASATNLNGYLTSVAAGDQEVLLAVNVNQFATGSNTDAWVYLRRQDTSNYYAARMTFTPAKQILAVFAKTASGTTTTVGTGTSTLTHVKTDWYWLRVQLTGTTSVNGKLRVWKLGTAEPSTWLVNASDATPPTQLRGTGHVGTRLQAAGTGPFPILGTYDGFTVGSIGSIASPDITAPTVPAGLATTPRSTSRVDLAWAASTDAVGVQLYRVFRGGTQVATVNTPAYIDTGLATNTTYSYTVAAVDAAGNASAQTGTVTGKTLAVDTTKPSTPSGVAAAAPAWNTVSVSWTASTDNVGVTRYLVFRGGTQLSVVGGSVTTFTDRSTAASTAYSYTVKAADAAGNTTVASSATGATTPAIPPTVLTTMYAYDAAGNLTSEATPDGVTAKSTYDRAGRLIEVANVTVTATLSRSSYRLDAVGNRIATTTTRGTQYDTYDVLNRLTNVCYDTSCAGGQSAVTCIACVGSPLATPAATVVPNAADIFTTYTYDAVGNRLTDVTYLGTTTYAYDTADRLTTRTPPGGPATAYTYDTEGRQITAGSNTFAYDLAGNLTDVTVGNVAQSFVYSGDGVRQWGSLNVSGNYVDTTYYETDRSFGLPQIAAERGGSGAVIRRYTYGLGLIGEHTSGVGPSFPHSDGLGSITDVTSPTGLSLAWTEYQPFGVVRTSGTSVSAPTLPFAYAAQYLDNTGLYDLRAREYDSAIGRFLSADPINLGARDPYVSRYQYAGDNPVRFADPSGKCIALLIIVCAIAVGAVIGVVTYVVTTVGTNVVANVVEHRSPIEDVGKGLNLLDAGISGVAGAVGGPVGGITFGATRVLAGVAVGCAATFASQAAGGRDRDLLETGIGCAAGGAASALQLKALGSAAYGAIVALAQALATYAEQRVPVTGGSTK